MSSTPLSDLHRPLRSWPALAALTLLVLTSLYAVYTLTDSINRVRTQPAPQSLPVHPTTLIQADLELLHALLQDSAEQPQAVTNLSAEITALRSVVGRLSEVDDDAENQHQLLLLEQKLSADIDQLERLINVAAANPGQSGVAMTNLSQKKLARMLQANSHAMATLSIQSQTDRNRQLQQNAALTAHGRWAIVLLGLLTLGLIALAIQQWQAFRKQATAQPDHDPVKSMIEGLPDGCMVLNQNREIKAHNSSAAKLLPEPAETLEGVDAASLYSQICLDSTQSRDDLSHWLDNLNADSTSTIELLDHQNRHLMIRERPTQDGEITAIIRDISDLKEAGEQLQQATDFDSLTGLPNRALFLRKLRSYARSDDPSIALVIIDLRDFRQLNDSYGQDIGDQLLISTSISLISKMPDDALVARISGDEFAVMVHPLDDKDQIEHATQDFLDELKRGVSAGTREIPVRASVGISYGPDHAVSPVELKNTADSACSQAKKQGSNTFAIFDRKLQENAERQRQIEMGLLTAIAQDELQIEYQPQINIKTNLTAGMEALVRWENDILGKVSPAEFIPTAEKSGLIVELGEWVLKKAISDYQQLASYGLSPGVLSVNLSRKQFDSPDLINSIKQVLQDTAMQPELLTLEITETAILDNREHAEAVLRQLHEIGVNLSIDDFGVGYSTFLELRDFPVNEVKIDRTFITDVTTCDNSQKIIQAIVNVAEAIGAEVVAEGIESQEQFDCIKSLGCHRAQGYFLCEPMSITAFPDMVLGGADSTVA